MTLIADVRRRPIKNAEKFVHVRRASRNSTPEGFDRRKPLARHKLDIGGFVVWRERRKLEIEADG
jgi:hypothetical protein